MNMLSKFFLILVASGLLVSCKNADTLNPEPSGAVRTVATQTTSSAPSWSHLSSCRPEAIENLVASAKEYIVISNDRFTKKYFYYTDSNCKNESFVFWQHGRIVNRGASPDVENAQLVDFDFRSSFLRPSNDEGSRALGAIYACAKFNWVTGEKFEITAIRGSVNCPNQGAPRITYDLMLIEGNNLYLGANADELNPLNRPKSVDASTALILKSK